LSARKLLKKGVSRSGASSWRDAERRNKLTADGWTLYTYTFLDAVRRPAGIAREVIDMHQRLTERLSGEGDRD
jgi:hypothetical protein